MKHKKTRAPTSPRKDKKIFVNTANRIRSLNVRPTVRRGGFRM